MRGTGKGGGRAQPLGLSVLGEDAIATLSILNEISNGVMLVTMATRLTSTITQAAARSTWVVSRVAGVVGDALEAADWIPVLGQARLSDLAALLPRPSEPPSRLAGGNGGWHRHLHRLLVRQSLRAPAKPAALCRDVGRRGRTAVATRAATAAGRFVLHSGLSGGSAAICGCTTCFHGARCVGSNWPRGGARGVEDGCVCRCGECNKKKEGPLPYCNIFVFSIFA